MPQFGERSFVEDLARGEDSVRSEREVTQRALRNASDALVDTTVMTPWERHRAEAESVTHKPTESNSADLYSYLEELRLSDPSQAPSRSRLLGRVGRRYRGGLR